MTDLAPQRRTVLGGLALAAFAASLGPTSAAADPVLDRHRHDFDFLVGDWKVRHTRLKGRLVGSTTWESFDGTSKLWLTLDGLGTVDDNLLHLPGGTYRAVGIRAFDPKTLQWAIWWLDGRNPGQIDAPVRGGFKDGVGVFEADDTLDGKPIRVRFTWSKITKTSAHWEQAFSPDAGKTWEVNWRMDFTRA